MGAWASVSWCAAVPHRHPDPTQATTWVPTRPRTQPPPTRGVQVPGVPGPHALLSHSRTDGYEAFPVQRGVSKGADPRGREPLEPPSQKLSPSPAL